MHDRPRHAFGHDRPGHGAKRFAMVLTSVASTTFDIAAKTSAFFGVNGVGESQRGMSPHPRRSRTRSIGDHVDFNDAPACQVGYADGRSCGQTIGRKIRHIEAIDRSIVALDRKQRRDQVDNVFRRPIGIPCDPSSYRRTSYVGTVVVEISWHYPSVTV